MLRELKTRSCMALSLTTSRRREKIINRSLWFIIHHIITSRNLTVILRKVKVYNNNPNNDLADHLVNILSINYNLSKFPIPSNLFWDSHVIDKPIRKFFKEVNANRRIFFSPPWHLKIRKSTGF